MSVVSAGRFVVQGASSERVVLETFGYIFAFCMRLECLDRFYQMYIIGLDEYIPHFLSESILYSNLSQEFPFTLLMVLPSRFSAQPIQDVGVLVHHEPWKPVGPNDHWQVFW